MDVSTLTSILLFILGVIDAVTGITAFRRYHVTQSDRLFIVGVSMTIAAIGVAGSALDKLPALKSLNLDYIWYISTSVGYLLLFLSSIMTSTEQFCILKRWSIIAGVIVIAMIALAPVFPYIVTSDPYIVVPINALRTVICALCFFRYLMLYTSKGTRFSLLMCLAFLFIAVSYAILIPQTLDPVSWQLPLVDTIVRIAGDAILLAAFVVG